MPQVNELSWKILCLKFLSIYLLLTLFFYFFAPLMILKRSNKLFYWFLILC